MVYLFGKFVWCRVGLIVFEIQCLRHLRRYKKWVYTYSYMLLIRARFLSRILGQVIGKSLNLVFGHIWLMECLSFLKWLHQSLGPKSLGLFSNESYCSPCDSFLMSPCINVNTIVMSLNAAPSQPIDSWVENGTGLYDVRPYWTLEIETKRFTNRQDNVHINASHHPNVRMI